MLTKGDTVSRGGWGQAARSNIQAGTSSHRSAAEPLNVQRKTTPLVRVSRDREHGFHRIVSKYFAGS